MTKVPEGKSHDGATKTKRQEEKGKGKPVKSPEPLGLLG